MLYSNDFLGIDLPIATRLIDVYGSSSLLCIQQSLNSPRWLCAITQLDLHGRQEAVRLLSHVFLCQTLL